jgi:hypothetical protein
MYEDNALIVNPAEVSMPEEKVSQAHPRRSVVPIRLTLWGLHVWNLPMLTRDALSKSVETGVRLHECPAIKEKSRRRGIRSRISDARLLM